MVQLKVFTACLLSFDMMTVGSRNSFSSTFPCPDGKGNQAMAVVLIRTIVTAETVDVVSAPIDTMFSRT